MKRLNKQFSYEVTLSPSDSKRYDFKQDVDSDAYAPFDNLVILNTGTEDIKAFLNDQEGFRLIPSGTILEVEDVDLTRLTLLNTSASNNAVFTFQVNNDLSQKKILNTMLDLQLKAMSGRIL